MSPGLQAANLIHAAGESSPGNLSSGTYAVALTVADAAELVDLGAVLKTREIPHTVITETEGAYAGQAMAIGIAPCDRDLARRLLSHLPLLGKAPKEVTGRAA